MNQHRGEIKGKLGEKIRDNAELGILSKRLARIITEVPIELASETLTRDAWDQDALMDVFEELEFRTLARRLGIERSNEKPTDAAPKSTKKVNLTSNDQMSLFGGEDTPSESTVSLSSRNSIANSDHFYQMVETLGEARQLAFLLAEKSSVAFDTETTSLEVLDAEVVGMSFSYAAGKAYYVNVPQERNKAMEWIHAFKPFWESEETEKIGQNIKYDISVLLNYDVQIKGPLFDTMIAHYLIQPDMRHNMDILAETYLNYETISIETLLGKKGKNQKNMRDIAPKEVLNYAAEDADITFQLKGVFEPKLIETGVEKVFKNIEMPLVPVLARMEREGIKIDVHSLRSYSGELGETIIRLEREIIELAGRPFNVGSPRQLGEVLFDDLKLSDKPKKTKTGQYATSEAYWKGYVKTSNY